VALGEEDRLMRYCGIDVAAKSSYVYVTDELMARIQKFRPVT
jgi:hypothetical protein